MPSVYHCRRWYETVEMNGLLILRVLHLEGCQPFAEVFSFQCFGVNRGSNPSLSWLCIPSLDIRLTTDNGRPVRIAATFVIGSFQEFSVENSRATWYP